MLPLYSKNFEKKYESTDVFYIQKTAKKAKKSLL